MKECVVCGGKFTPKKHYFRACHDCAKTKVARCRKCGKTVYAQNDMFTCCGISECVHESNSKNRVRRRVIADMINDNLSIPEEYEDYEGYDY